MNMFALNDDALNDERVITNASIGLAKPLRSALEEGGDPNYVRLDIAPSLITTMRDYVECLTLLLENNARGDIPNRMGWTAIHEAAQKENNECLNLLLSYPEQTRFNVRDDRGWTALFVAMKNDRFENANALLKAMPDLLEMENGDGITPLMWSVQEKKEDWLEWCLRRGANVERSNEKGQTAGSLASVWDRGQEMISDLSSVTVSFEAAPVKAKEVEEVEEEKAPANPFGLGGVKKKIAK